MINRPIVVADIESTSINPNTCEITQIGAVAIDTFRLDFIRDAEGNPETFNIRMKVMEPDKIEAGALAVTRMTVDKIQQGVDPEVGWKAFTDWVKKFDVPGSNTVWAKAALGGQNVIAYDNVVFSRYCLKFGPMTSGKNPEPKLFHPYFKFDTLHLLPALFIGSKEPEKFNLPAILSFFGFSDEEISGSHDALNDTVNCAKVLLKVLQLFDKLSNGLEVPCSNCHSVKRHRIKFKDAFRTTQ